MLIGAVATRVGVTPDTIRYYEREGLLPPPPRTSSGYRDYGPETVGDLLFIKKAQSVGLSLGAVREVLDISSSGGQPCDHVRAVVAERLAEVDGRLRELQRLRATLRKTLERLDRVPPARSGCRCPAIEAT